MAPPKWFDDIPEGRNKDWMRSRLDEKFWLKGPNNTQPKEVKVFFPGLNFARVPFRETPDIYWGFDSADERTNFYIQFGGEKL